MRRSLLTTEKGRCYLCGKYGPTEKHHVFGGPNRQKSELYGLYVFLCHDCHNEPPNGVHFNKNRNRELQRLGQKAFEEKYRYEFRCGDDMARDAFMKEFGKNYIY